MVLDYNQLVGQQTIQVQQARDIATMESERKAREVQEQQSQSVAVQPSKVSSETSELQAYDKAIKKVEKALNTEVSASTEQLLLNRCKEIERVD